jgi:hypothetical protein
MASLLRRSFVSIFGILAVAWATQALLIHHQTPPLADAAQRILSGEKFSVAQLNAMKRLLNVTPSGSPEASTLSSAAVVHLFLLEDQLRTGVRKASASDLAELKMIVDAALAQSPTNSFMWLADVSTKRLRGEFTEGDFDLLRMSYGSSPNEAWIEVRRNPLTVSLFPSLPNDLKDRAVSEFARLVGAGLYEDASNILAGPGRPVHGQLLNGLIQVNEANRRVLAGVLEEKGLDEMKVPGLAEQSSRPF